MEIKYPCIITARLLPGIQIGDSFLSIEYGDVVSETRLPQYSRQGYVVHLDTPTFEYTIDDIRSGCCGGTLRRGLLSALSFLGACGASVNYERYSGRKGENADLFPPHVAEWCAVHEDDLSLAGCELEETENAIDEG